ELDRLRDARVGVVLLRVDVVEDRLPRRRATLDALDEEVRRVEALRGIGPRVLVPLGLVVVGELPEVTAGVGRGQLAGAGDQRTLATGGARRDDEGGVEGAVAADERRLDAGV